MVKDQGTNLVFRSCKKIEAKSNKIKRKIKKQTSKIKKIYINKNRWPNDTDRCWMGGTPFPGSSIANLEKKAPVRPTCLVSSPSKTSPSPSCVVDKGECRGPFFFHRPFKFIASAGCPIPHTPQSLQKGAMRQKIKTHVK